MVRYVKTFVKGFDKELDGGIPYGHLVLISGSPGTMKSTLAYSIMYNNVIKSNMSGSYISLEQSAPSLTFHLNQAGFKTSHAVKDKVQVIDLAKIRKELKEDPKKDWLDVLKLYIEYLVKENDYDILIIDSLPVVEIMAKMKDRRSDLFFFFEWLRDLSVTTFIIIETAEVDKGLLEEEFLADGIINMSMKVVGDVDVQRRIRCVKMRGANHNMCYFSLEFKKGVFKIAPAI
jgi:KaiC/GvpD/RAD55 family RecA-like ATPase